MIGIYCADCGVDVFDGEGMTQINQINFIFVAYESTWEEGVDALGQFHCAYSQEWKHENHANNTESSANICLKVWTFLERKLHSLTEEV